MITFVCTTINPGAQFLVENIDFFTKQGIRSEIVLDRKVQSLEARPYLNFLDTPANLYERVCPWDSYSRKNIGFLRAAARGDDVFETDDDNQFIGSMSDLEQDWDELVSACIYEDHPNLFKLIYDHVEDVIWARGFPIDHREHQPRKTECKSAIVGVVQFLVDGNPDVDAIFRLVKGNEIHYRSNPNALPIDLFGSFHPINSQGTLWPRKNLCLAYLPATCEFRMTDIWRGYIAQKILYAHNECVRFTAPKLIQERNPHDIADDFRGELKGYAEVYTVLRVLNELPQGSKEDMLLEAYRRLCDKEVFDKKEMILLTEYLKELAS